MPDLNDFKKQIAAIRQAVAEKLPDIATSLTLSAKALAERRTKDAGFGEIYSENKIPSWFLTGKELNAAGPAYIKRVNKQKVDRGLGNWKEFRAAQGLQTGHVDLSFTNKMWANMQPLEARIVDGVISAPLGATNIEAQNKMNWNRDRYGDFIGKALLPEDFNTLGAVVIDGISDILQSFNQ